MENTKIAPTGVSYDKRKNKWVARIRLEGKRHWLGTFVNQEEAIEARKEAEAHINSEFEFKRYYEKLKQKLKEQEAKRRQEIKLDLVGKRFGKLVAVKPTGEKKYGVAVWLCECDCGNMIALPRNYLTRGITKDCRCVRVK